MEESTSEAVSGPRALVGQHIGSYRIVEPLGSGGMSTVFRAVHDETGLEVALKVLLGGFARSSTLLQRFLREARSAENLEHPNIVAIYDRGVDQGRHYLVLEYVPGGDFHDYVQRNGPLGAAEAIGVIRGVASGLKYAAGRGLIHRDIKPSNILRTPRGEAKIIDLGLALQSQFEDERVTREGTTVGTVDYMAPEQARDSRATSVQSDLYSLGCTFYYLLAGVPPFPGGDITDKLTRHARAPAPDIRDLRPDIPAGLAAILLRMMAKQPEDRFANYDDLIAALDAVKPQEGDGSPGIALVPLGEDAADDSLPVLPDNPPARDGSAAASWVDGSEESSLLGSAGVLSLDLADERSDVAPPPPTGRREPPLPRMGRPAAPIEPESVVVEALLEPESETVLSPRAEPSYPPWIIPSIAGGSIAVLMLIVLLVVLGGRGTLVVPSEEIPEPAPALSRPPAMVGSPPPPPGVSGRAGLAGRTPRKATIALEPAPAHLPERWVEPADIEPEPGDAAAIEGDVSVGAHLPEWARARPATRGDGPRVVVRRVPDSADGATEPALHLALDQHAEGTVELADVGPLAADDLRVSGESRVIRPRRGYRPSIRILRSRNEAAKDQTAFLGLERKTLTLEGVDLIVDARVLSGRQVALFGCAGSNLTLRDCTITVINPRGVRVSVIRQEPHARPSRILVDRTLIRGGFTSVAELTAGAVDLVFERTAILGGIGPVVKVGGATGKGAVPVAAGGPGVPAGSAALDRRVYFASALLACPGPVIQGELLAGGASACRLSVRADGTVFGRLQGQGIASLVCMANPDATADRTVVWAGDRNVYYGWKGFFARGPEPTITVGGLVQARSTWNATERGSQEILVDLPLTLDAEHASPAELSPHLPPDRKWLATAPARPSVGLFPRALDGYAEPIVPDVLAWAAAPTGFAPGGIAATAPMSRKVIQYNTKQAAAGGVPGTAGGVPGPAGGVHGIASQTASGPADLEFNTANPRWGGDLGAFLHAAIPPGARHLRVRVQGSGAHRWTPVRLPDGLTLEIRVEVPPGAEPLSWSCEPLASGPGMIELHGGAIVLSHVIMKHDPTSRLSSLLSLHDSHLVLYRCQLLVPPEAGGIEGNLIEFSAPSSRPIAPSTTSMVFQSSADRPICRLIDTILIANGTAVRAELGRGLVAMTGCAMAADDTVLALDPGKVARNLFVTDLRLERCTLVAGHSIVRLGPWAGKLPGPDRPWVVDSRRCVFLTLSDRRSLDAALLRVDADAMAGGCLYWQSDSDAYDLEQVTVAGEVPPPLSRTRDLSYQWLQFRNSNRMGGFVGPRAPAIRLRDRPRPGRLEPSDLILESTERGRQGPLEVGADVASLGVAARDPRMIPPRN